MRADVPNHVAARFALDIITWNQWKTQVGAEARLRFALTDTRTASADILATGTRHDVKVQSAAGDIPLGSVNLLPPTLTLQWHFMPDTMFDPYVGAGLSYVRAMDRSLNAGGAIPIHIDRNSWGPAVQAGLDINLKDGWLINADVKKIWFDPDVKAQAGGVWYKIDSLDVDPWVVSVGLGKKF